MKIFAISVLGLLVVLAIAGCNPVGMDDTRVYVRGLIFADTSHTTFAEGIGVMTFGTPESYVTNTGADGRFWFEIQMYPDTSCSITGAVKFGVTAYSGLNQYNYGGGVGSSQDSIFTVFGGDTLNLYDIDLSMFTEGKLGGSN
ncbi:MAG: hypothetical protein K8S15_06270 [Candidatus Aegiribacteria sp.]|nr:hypothetical protein [Candidatus Aegiribacteria sp.]